MALIGKIREKSTLLMIVIGVGMVLFIVPYDSVIKMFSGGQADNSIGTFNGDPMYSNDWRFEQQVRNLKFQYSRNGQQIPDDYARSAIFYQMIDDSLLNMELRKVGVTTTLDELDAIQTGTGGVEISKYIKELPYFQDINKQFSKDSLDKKLPIYMNQENGGWDQIETQLRRTNMIYKYVSMVSKGIIVTDYEAKRDFTESNEKANLQYVYKRFNDVPDSAITITDADYQAYYDEHKADKKYEMEETRGFEFITINIIPSASDSAFANKKLEKN